MGVACGPATRCLTRRDLLHFTLQFRGTAHHRLPSSVLPATSSPVNDVVQPITCKAQLPRPLVSNQGGLPLYRVLITS